jgi:hypothetical protein
LNDYLFTEDHTWNVVLNPHPHPIGFSGKQWHIIFFS